MATKRHFAVLLCRYADTEEDYDVDYYRRLFTVQGVGTGNIVDYFHEASNGRADLADTEVFEAIPLGQNRADYVGSGVNQAGRMELVNWARAAAAAEGVDVAGYPGGVVVLTLPGSDVFGNDGFAVLAPESIGLGVAAHEMGHALGLEHSWSETSADADYMDPFDMMSWQATRNPQHPEYGVAGPLLNGINMRRLGWLDESRVVEVGAGTHEITLRPLTREDLGGNLAAQVDQYLIEYRPDRSWDRAIGRSGVQIHSLNGDRSVLHFGTLGQGVIGVGESFARGLPWMPYERRLNVTVLSLSEEQAVLSIRVNPAEPEPRVGPGITLGGIDVGGGGWLITGGGIVKVPPREPVIAMLEHIALLAAADTVRDEELRARLRVHALEQIQDDARRDLHES